MSYVDNLIALGYDGGQIYSILKVFGLHEVFVKHPFEAEKPKKSLKEKYQEQLDNEISIKKSDGTIYTHNMSQKSKLGEEAGQAKYYNGEKLVPLEEALAEEANWKANGGMSIYDKLDKDYQELTVVINGIQTLEQLKKAHVILNTLNIKSINMKPSTESLYFTNFHNLLSAELVRIHQTLINKLV